MKATMLGGIFLLILCTQCWARNGAEVTGELTLRVHMPEESKDDTREILDGYIEYARQDGYALTAYGAIEKGSWSAYSGVAKHCFNDRLEFGVMAGVAHYDNELHPALNPWIFYESHRWEFMLFTENYFDTDKPNFLPWPRILQSWPIPGRRVR